MPVANFSSCSPCSPAFHAFVVVSTIFGFFRYYSLVIAFGFSFFVISYTLSTYINLSLYKRAINSLHFTLAIESGSFPTASFLHFISSISPFSAAKHSSEDDNSEDGWLDLFLLEEEGSWLGFEVN